MMRHEWMIQVLEDLRSYADANGLASVDNSLSQALADVLRENRVEERGGDEGRSTYAAICRPEREDRPRWLK